MKMKIEELHSSENGRFVIAGTNKEALIWDMSKKELLKKIKVLYTEMGERLAIDNLGRYIAAATYSGSGVTLYSIESGEVIWTLRNIDKIQRIKFIGNKNILSVTSNNDITYWVNVIGGDIFADMKCRKILDNNEEVRIMAIDKNHIRYEDIDIDIKAGHLAGVITPLGIAISQLGGGLSFWNKGKNLWNSYNNKNEHIVKLSYIEKLDCIAGIIYKYNSPRKEPFFKLACYNIKNGELMYENDLDNGIDFVFVENGNEILSSTGNMYSIEEKQINLLMNIRKKSN